MNTTKKQMQQNTRIKQERDREREREEEINQEKEGMIEPRKNQTSEKLRIKEQGTTKAR